MRKIVVGVMGGTVVLVGIALIFLPGPAFVVIPAGFAILATEFVWARHALKRSKELAVEAKEKTKEVVAQARQKVKMG